MMENGRGQAHVRLQAVLRASAALGRTRTGPFFSGTDVPGVDQLAYSAQSSSGDDQSIAGRMATAFISVPFSATTAEKATSRASVTFGTRASSTIWSCRASS